MTAIADFRLTATDFVPFGAGLTRPECVWHDTDGIWVSDARTGGVARVTAAGLAPLGAGIHEPNGFTRRANGAFVVAGLCDHRVHQIAPDGTTTVLCAEVDGRPLGVVNFTYVDAQDRIWVAVTTHRAHWADALNAGAEGYLVLIDAHGARIVADGLHHTNECKVGPGGTHLYVAETLGRRILRFPIRPDGSLGLRETVGPDRLGYGAFPDGFAFDGDGNLWVTLVTRGGIAVITPDGALHTVFDEANEAALKTAVDAMTTSTATLEMVGACYGPTLKLPTSFAFGGPDGKTVYVGSLAGTELLTFRSPVAGPRAR